MREIKAFVPQSLKNIYHLCQAILANLWYGFPSRRINPHTKFIPASLIRALHSHKIGVGVKVIGVTGTNGKTTTVQMIARILEEDGKKVAVASTINFKLNGEGWVNKTKFTTLSSFQVQKFIKKAAENGSEYLVLETSSHSLDQYRVWGVKYNTAVITNITREHLDYHKTMEIYGEAKKRLFKMVEKNRGKVVVNLDMEGSDKFLRYGTDSTYGYTIQNQNLKIPGCAQWASKNQNDNSKLKIVKAENVKLGINYSKFEISAPSQRRAQQGGPASGWQNLQFTLNIPGMFNVENALAAICVGLSENIKLETISIALEKIKVIPGRMEYVKNGKNLNIIIDYAVTPDSLEKLYGLVGDIRSRLSEVPNNSQIIAVFGSCGERDRGKRPIMGEIVSKFADQMIITNEDPYGEDPKRIIDEIACGVRNKKEGKNFWKISDRREAIKKALHMANPGDFIVVSGKGAEETMAIGKKRIPWNDRKIIEDELQKLQ